MALVKIETRFPDNTRVVSYAYERDLKDDMNLLDIEEMLHREMGDEVRRYGNTLVVESYHGTFYIFRTEVASCFFMWEVEGDNRFSIVRSETAEPEEYLVSAAFAGMLIEKGELTSW
jgi:hypothetical protein